MSSSRDEIRDAFNSVTKELGLDKEPRDSKWLENILDFISSHATFFKVVLFIVIILFLAFIIYRVLQHFSSSNKKIRNKDIPLENIDKTKAEMLQLLYKFKAGNKYNLATLQLHYITIYDLELMDYLQPNRDYTNREIDRILKGKKQHRVFHNIATNSQGILFNDERVSSQSFNSMYNNYLEEFN